MMAKNKRITDTISIFRERRLPEAGTLVGYGALIQRFKLSVPVPRKLSLASERHRHREDGQWRVFTVRGEARACDGRVPGLAPERPRRTLDD